MKEINTHLTGFVINGDLNQRYIGNINLSFSNINGAKLFESLSELAVSAG